MAGRGLDAGLTATVQALWEQARPAALERLNVLDDAVAAVMAGALDDDLRERAMRESHKLAGSLGTFGLRDATHHAAALETAFMHTPPAERAPQLAEHAVELRRLVEAGETCGAAVSPDREPDVVAVGLPVALAGPRPRPPLARPQRLGRDGARGIPHPARRAMRRLAAGAAFAETAR